MVYPVPGKENDRQLALEDYEILDTVPEREYDDLTQLAAYLFDTPIALITFIDQDRQWIKSGFGLETRETPREQAFCAHAIMEPEDVMVVEDALEDDRFKQNELVKGDPFIRFYAGAPLITPDGQVLGTICVIDRVPRQFSQEKARALSILSRQVMSQLELRKGLKLMEMSSKEQETYTRQLEEYQQRIEGLLQEVQTQSLTDGLTGAHNRNAFEKMISDEFSRAQRYGTSLSLLMLDVDHFKDFNDEFGHPAGDEVLKQVVELLSKCSRRQDILARYGGEEFVIILPNTSRNGAVVLAERFRRVIQRASWPQRAITISIGGAMLFADMEEHQALIDRADGALYEAKNMGRNMVRFAD